MNKQERIQTIQTIRKQMQPRRILSVVFTGGAYSATHFFDQSIWSILVFLCALVISGVMLSRESSRNQPTVRLDTCQTIDSTPVHRGFWHHFTHAAP